MIEYKDNIILSKIFDYLKRFILIKISYDHNIEYIKQKIKLSSELVEQKKIVKKYISFLATGKLMIALTKDVGHELDKIALYQFKKYMMFTLNLNVINILLIQAKVNKQRIIIILLKLLMREWTTVQNLNILQM